MIAHQHPLIDVVAGVDRSKGGGDREANPSRRPESVQTSPNIARPSNGTGSGRSRILGPLSKHGSVGRYHSCAMAPHEDSTTKYVYTKDLLDALSTVPVYDRPDIPFCNSTAEEEMPPWANPILDAISAVREHHRPNFPLGESTAEEEMPLWAKQMAEDMKRQLKDLEGTVESGFEDASRERNLLHRELMNEMGTVKNEMSASLNEMQKDRNDLLLSGLAALTAGGVVVTILAFLP